MLVIAGLSVKNLKPRVWDPASPHYLPELRAVMVSYAEVHALPTFRKKMVEVGLRSYLGLPETVRVYLDNGAFYFLRRGGKAPIDGYKEFVEKAKPDWYPIPEEFIPTPAMPPREQFACYERTMKINLAYQDNGFVPVIHVGRSLEDYLAAVIANSSLSGKSRIAVGGIVPNLLRAPKALPYNQVLASLWRARRAFAGKDVHVFGMGGTATIHLAALMGFDSVDSSGWRNRAARGIVQMPGKGDRIVAELGNWRGRRADHIEMKALRKCRCPACRTTGISGLRGSGVQGFCSRATHNLWVLLKEANWVQARIEAGTYARLFRRRLDNTIYLPLIEEALRERTGAGKRRKETV